MNYGVYNTKYAFRKFVAIFFPLVKDLSPNTISWMLLPIGVITAVCYYYTNTYPMLFLVGYVLILSRLIIGTLDGAVAEIYNKSSLKGAVVNRIAPEICDLMLLIAISLSSPHLYLLSIFAFAIAWFTSFLSLIGLAGGKEFLTNGPIAQPDRIVHLSLFSLAAFLLYIFNASVDIYKWFLWWLIVGGVITIIIRLNKLFSQFKEEVKTA